VKENSSRVKLPEEILLLNLKLRNFFRTLELLRAAKKFVPSNIALQLSDRTLKDQK
jgi:hypothetical protein